MSEHDATARVVLASTSAYRRALLARLLSGFDWLDPAIDETPVPAERPADRAGRLARAKALAGAARTPGAWVIGSDQVAALGDEILRKPGSVERAAAQLARAAGRELALYTAVCLVAPDGAVAEAHLDHARIVFRDLGRDEIERYLAREPAIDCAGSFKSEGLGVALMERLAGEDPTAIEGLPLIWLAGALRRAGFAVP